MTEETIKLFLYGTLMSNGCRQHVMAGQRHLKNVRTTCEYVLLDLGSFPGLVPENPGIQIAGELWEVSKSLIPRLDQIEGSPRMYKLQLVNISGEEGPIYTYIYQLRSKNSKVYQDSHWKN